MATEYGEMTQEQLIERLRLEAEHESARRVADRYGVSHSFLSNVLHGIKPVSPRLAEAMGFRRVVRFERIDG